MSYIKISDTADKSLVYYIKREFFKEIQFSGPSLNLNLMRLSDFVINKETNQFVKCRYNIEDIVDSSITKITFCPHDSTR